MEDVRGDYSGHIPEFLVYLSQVTLLSLVLLTLYRTRTSL
jgi:hypothetical protein